jgi:hypothetical protein
MPLVLLILSLPVGAVVYALTAEVLDAMGLKDAGQGLLALFVPLFVAGLAMIPLLIPFFDRKAKADLAAYRLTQTAELPGDATADDAEGEGVDVADDPERPG